MKPNRQKPTIHTLVPKAAFGVAGVIIFALFSSACQFETQVHSSALPAGQSMATQSSVTNEELPSLVISDPSSSAPSSEVSPPSSTVASQVVSSVSSALVSKASSESVSEIVSFTPASSQVVSKVPSANVSDRVFDDAVFVGNSLMEDLYTYGGAGNADFYYRVGLTVRTVFTKPTARGSVPVIDELKGKSYGKVLLMFGENELGWSYADAFIQDYGKVIDAVRQRQPNATIYVQSILPVSKAASDRNENQVNNPRIQQYNSKLKELAAQKGAVYLDVAGALQDSQGNLPNDAASDGIHPNRKYCLKWLDYLRQHLA